MEAEDRKVRERQAWEITERAKNKRRKQKKFQYSMLKCLREDVKEEPLTSSDDEEDVEESRKDARHRRRKHLVKSLKTVGKMIDKKLQGETEVDPKTKKKIPKTSLGTKTFQRYLEAKKSAPDKFRELYTLDRLERLHELVLSRAEKVGLPTVKELIELEEKSVRAPTVKEILRDKPLDDDDDNVGKTLALAEGDDDTEVEAEVMGEAAESAEEPEGVEEETET